MFRRILVTTDGSESAATGLGYALNIAQRHGATLCALHVVDVKLLEGPFLRDLSASLGTAPYVNYQGKIALLLEERGKSALNDFREKCESSGVSCDTVQVTGIVAHAIVEQSELADLVVMGRGGEHSQWLEGLLGSTTEAVIRRSKQPVLVTGTPDPGDDLLLAAYDGSQHARSALRVAANIAHDWRMRLQLLVVGEEEDRRIVDEARDYLQAHTVDVLYEMRTGDPGEAIVQCAAESGADLIVMGGYGHSKVREFVVGSTTKYAINHAPCPVLLSR